MSDPDRELVDLWNAGDYGSEFEYDTDVEKRKRSHEDLKDLHPKKKRGTGGVARKNELDDEYSKDQGRMQRFHILGMDAFARHKKYVNDYMLFYGGNKNLLERDESRDKRDMDVIRDNHRFLWTEDGSQEQDTWEKRLAKKYYDKLFKEYCIVDLNRYKENKIGMRWQIEKEVVEGKGQFSCGSKRCSEQDVLRTWEVNFGYSEHGEKKNALVKLRLCPDCSYKLNYHHKRKDVTKHRRKQQQQQPSTSDSDNQKTGSHPQQRTQELDKHRSNEENSNEDNECVVRVSDKSVGETSPEQGIWSEPAKLTDDKTREEEFDDYFEDMFL